MISTAPAAPVGRPGRRRIGLLVLCAVAACSDGSGASDARRAAAATTTDSLQAEAERIYAEGDIQQAVDLLEQTVDLAREVGDSAALARGLTWRSQAAWRLGDYEQTRRHGEEALAIKLASGDAEDLFRSYNILGLLAWNESRPFDAVELFRHAREAAAARADTTNLAKVWNNLGLVHLSLGEYEEAREQFVAAREAAAALDEPLIEGRVLINLGNLDIETGRPRSAVEHLEAASPLLRTAEDAIGEQVLLGHLGTAHLALGDAGRAREYLELALSLAREAGLRQEEAINLEQLGELHRTAGDHREALRLFAEARAINDELGLVDETAADLRSEAAIHAELGDELLAFDKIRRALATHEEIGYPLEQIQDQVTMAGLAASLGWPDSVRSYLDAAEAAAKRLASPTARLTIGLGRARTAREMNRPADVLRALEPIGPDLRVAGDVWGWESESLRAWAEAALGDPEAAILTGRRAIAAIERTRARYGDDVVRASHLNSREDVYVEQVRALLAAGRLTEAWQTADALRARALLEHLAIGRTGGDLGPAARNLIDGESMLRRAVDLRDRVEEIESLEPDWRAEGAEAQLERLRGELEASRDSYRDMVRRARAEDPRGAAMLGASSVESDAVRAALRPDETLIEYLVTSDGVVAFALTRDTLLAVRTPLPRARLATRVRIARAEAGTPGGDPRGALEGLYADLVAPVAATGVLRGAARLLIVPHRELTYVPFAALRNPGTGRYLVEDYLVAHLPVAGILPLLRTAPAALPPGVVAFAPAPAELPRSVAEIRAIERIQRTELRQGGAATERRLRDDLASPSAVHVAAHGRLNVVNPMYSRIELAGGTGSDDDDGRLEVTELLEMRVRSPLIFLSGCDTGRGVAWSTGFTPGEDYATLARALLYAGAQTVVATLWSIQDDSAARFAETFYTTSPGEDVLGALARAQRAMIGDAEYSDPYYWAAYRLTGRGELRLAAQ